MAYNLFSFSCSLVTFLFMILWPYVSPLVSPSQTVIAPKWTFLCLLVCELQHCLLLCVFVCSPMFVNSHFAAPMSLGEQFFYGRIHGECAWTLVFDPVVLVPRPCGLCSFRPCPWPCSFKVPKHLVLALSQNFWMPDVGRAQKEIWSSLPSQPWTRKIASLITAHLTWDQNGRHARI